ncbi:TonB-dependent receptor, partial [Novosphingobium sp. ST904]
TMVVPAYAQAQDQASTKGQPQSQAQAARAAREGAREEDIKENIQEIIVTARRKEELIQDVPQAIQAVTGASLEKLNLFSFDDLSKVAAGVSLNRAGNLTTIRGVSFNPTAQTNPTVAMYINDAPVQPTIVFQSVFDVEQFEILRGPQGTMRGQSAPTGAITITTRKPNLYRHGATAMATFTDRDGRTLQGAANIPIVEGVLGIRFAGILDHSNNGGIKSVNNPEDPYANNNAFRASVRFEPTDNLSVNFMYQKRWVKSLSYGSAVYGDGAPGGTFRASGYALPYVQPVGVNGPALEIGDRRAVAENGDFGRSTQEVATGQIEYVLAGQKLSYVGAWSNNDTQVSRNYADTANLVVGDWPGRSLDATLTRWTHELRLSSDERLLGGHLEYVIGVFHENEKTVNVGNNGVTFQSGAFGSPLGAPIAQSPNLDFSTTSLYNSNTKLKEWSYFGTLTLHIDDKTELSGGIRFINESKDGLRTNSQSAGYRAEASCVTPGGIRGRTYANVCDVPVASRVTGTIPDVWKKTPTVYSASLSRHWTNDVVTYFNYGSSWRPGPTQGNLINGANDPTLSALTNLKDEKTNSYELGLKTSWLDRRLNLNLAVYHQDYTNYVYSVLTGIPYLADTGVPGTTPAVTLAVPMNSNIDAKVDGVDFDFNFAATKNWTISGGASWANGRFKNQLIPCWDGNFDGVPDNDTSMLLPAFLLPPGVQTGVQRFQSRGISIAECKVSGRSALQPKWNATLRTEYSHPISNGTDAFISGLLTYTPKNPYANATYTVPDYALANLNIGVRNYEAGWELQVFARNLFDTRTVTDKGVSAVTDTPDVSSTFGVSGYRSYAALAPRELGITFRYSFGSR